MQSMVPHQSMDDEPQRKAWMAISKRSVTGMYPPLGSITSEHSRHPKSSRFRWISETVYRCINLVDDQPVLDQSGQALQPQRQVFNHHAKQKLFIIRPASVQRMNRVTPVSLSSSGYAWCFLSFSCPSFLFNKFLFLFSSSS